MQRLRTRALYAPRPRARQRITTRSCLSASTPPLALQVAPAAVVSAREAGARNSCSAPKSSRLSVNNKEPSCRLHHVALQLVLLPRRGGRGRDQREAPRPAGERPARGPPLQGAANDSPETTENPPPPQPSTLSLSQDILWLIVFIAFNIVALVVAGLSLKYGVSPRACRSPLHIVDLNPTPFCQGEPLRLINGVDSFGNICGVDNTDNGLNNEAGGSTGNFALDMTGACCPGSVVCVCSLPRAPSQPLCLPPNHQQRTTSCTSSSLAQSSSFVCRRARQRL